MTRRDWWLGVFVVALVLLLHAAIPRYEWRSAGSMPTAARIDRWTGDVHRLYQRKLVPLVDEPERGRFTIPLVFGGISLVGAALGAVVVLRRRRAR
jgi:hypothetical protein